MLNKKVAGLALATMLVLPVGAVSANTGTKATDQFEQLKEQFSKATSASPQQGEEQQDAPAVEGTPPTSGEEVNPEEDMKATDAAPASDTPSATPQTTTKEADAAVQTFTTDNPSATKGTTPIASDTATADPVSETAKENSNEMALAQTEQQISQYVQNEMAKEFKAQVDLLKEDQKQTMYLVFSGVAVLSFVLGLFGGFLYSFSRRKEYY